MNLASILSEGAVLPQIAAKDKKQALKTLAAHAAKLSGLPEREVYSVLQAREHLGCTGMGGGVCIPHGRFESLNRLYAMVATLDTAIDFDSADGRPVDILCLLLTPSAANTEHLKALAVISRLLRDKELCAAIRKSRSASEIYRLLTAEREENLR